MCNPEKFIRVICLSVGIEYTLESLPLNDFPISDVVTGFQAPRYKTVLSEKLITSSHPNLPLGVMAVKLLYSM